MARLDETEVKDRLVGAFAPLECQVAIHDYKAKLTFRVVHPEGRRSIVMRDLRLDLQRNSHLLIRTSKQ